MGLIISYYLKPQSLQLLEDYMKPCIGNNVSYSRYKDLYYYDNNFTDANATTDACTDADDGNHYKLYIYVYNADTNGANSDLKNMYEESSNKHNAKVDSYLKSCSSKLLNAEEVEENKFGFILS
jgi:hypothetical protein